MYVLRFDFVTTYNYSILWVCMRVYMPVHVIISSVPMQCLEVYTSSNEADQDAIDTLETLKDFETNELASYLENALKPLDSSQQDFLQSFAGSREFYVSQLQQMSQHQKPMIENGFFNRGNPTEVDQPDIRGQGGRGPPSDSPTHTPHPLAPQGKESMERPFPHMPPGGFPPLHVPMGQYPPMMMQRPLMMFQPSFLPYPPMPPYPMMPPAMIRPNMVDPNSPMMARPHPPSEQACSEHESSPVPNDDVISKNEESHEVKNPDETSHPVGTHLVATSAPPTAAFQLMPTTVPPPEASSSKNDNGKNVKSAKSSTKKTVESTKPPPTPFEAKNPYDSVPIEKEPSPAVDDTPPVAGPICKDNTDDPTTLVVDESQNLPCRRGKAAANQKQAQQRFPKNNPPRQRPRQNRTTQVQQSTKQESTTDVAAAAAKPVNKSDDRSRKEPTTAAKEPTLDGQDSATKGKL